MKLLMDSDIFVYRIGYSSQDKDEGIAVWRLDKLIRTIKRDLKSKTYKCFLTSQDHSNFRYEVDPAYKSHRIVPKPIHYLALREHIIKNHPTEMVTGMEADDAIGIAQTENTCIVSLDKDLDQIPGRHYNFVKKEEYYIDENYARYFFYYQCLVGDTADGIKGLKGYGDKKSSNALKGLMTEDALFDKVSKLYQAKHPEDWQERLLKAGQLLKIRRTKDEGLWQFPQRKTSTDQV